MKYFFHTVKKEEFFTQESLFLKSSNKEPIVIGIPKENILIEPRLPYTPEGVQILTDSGYEVIVEAGAGNGINYSDRSYAEAGAFITDNKALVFSADVIFKIFPPTVDEAKLIKEKAAIFSMLQINFFPIESLRILQQKKATAIAYDFLQDENQNLSVINSICEIEGNVAISVISELMSSQHGGKGILLGGVAGAGSTELVLIGASIAGITAAQIALSMGCSIKIFDHNINNLRKVKEQLSPCIFTSVFHPKTIHKALISADAVIGCIRYPDENHKYIVSEDAVSKMKKGAIIVDMSIDQGRCFETSVATTFTKPYYIQHGVIHFCLPNISARAARTASMALSNVLTDEMLQIHADGGILNSIKKRLGFCNGVYLYNGILANSYVGMHFGLPSNDIRLLLAAF